MSIYSKVVSTILPIRSVHTTVEGAVHGVGAVYTFINGERKKLFPEENPVSDPTITYNTPGTHTVTLGPGYYKFSISGAGGGAACSYKGSGSANMGGTVAGGGAGAYGTFELMLNVQETFTFVLGSGGTGSVGGDTRYGTDGTVTTVSSNLRGTFITLNPGTGASGWWEDSRGGHHWQNAGSGGTYSTTLTSGYTFYNGSNGTADASNAYARDYWGYGGDNPAPYTGDGGTAHFYKSDGMSNVYANNGQSGWVKIEPAVQYIYTNPITTSITLDPGTYYFEIVGAGGGGLGVTGASCYAYGNGGSGASGYGYFTVATQGVYNIQCGTGGTKQSGSGGVTDTGTWTSGNGTASYIIRAADNFNIVTCGGGTGVSWHYDGDHSGGEYFNYFGQAGTYSTSLSNNYTLANGRNGTGTYSTGDNQYNFDYVDPVYFSEYGKGGFGRRLYLSGYTHEGANGFNGMLKIYKYS